MSLSGAVTASVYSFKTLIGYDGNTICNEPYNKGVPVLALYFSFIILGEVGRKYLENQAIFIIIHTNSSLLCVVW